MALQAVSSAFCLALVAWCAAAPSALGNEGENAAWSKPNWIADALRAMKSGRYPRVRGLSYWHEKFEDDEHDVEVDLRIDSSTEALKSYRDGSVSPYFVSKAEIILSGDLYRLALPRTGIYLGAFPGFDGDENLVTEEAIRDYEDLARHSLAWVYFSDNWFGKIRFPKSTVALIHQSGRVPFIRMMMRSDDDSLPDSRYSLQKILDKAYDEDLKKWAREARRAKGPMVVEFGTEANGDWFPWTGTWNGGGNTFGYGDFSVADGPERFRDAFRHLVRLFRAEGAHNVAWAFHVDSKATPKEPWNTMRAYYPGDDYVDWIGLSVYGPQRPTASRCHTFTQVLDGAYAEATALSKTKPLAVLEWGIAEPRFPLNSDDPTVICRNDPNDDDDD